MNKVIGFYSHIPLSISNDNLYTPSHIGKYLDMLAKSCKTLVVIGHCSDFNKVDFDYDLKSNNIKFINLGLKKKSLNRFFFGFKYFLGIDKSYFDHIIVRSPTPLSHWFRIFFKKNKLSYLLVADEKEGAINKKILSYRDFVIKIYLLVSDFILFYCVKGTLSFVNSKFLFKKYNKSNVKIVSTSNIENEDYVKKLKFSFHNPLKLLYVGRLDVAKGILETIEAVVKLNKLGHTSNYNIVGWDDSDGLNEKIIAKKIDELDAHKYISFSGKKSHGTELNEIYRDSDIHIIASYSEGMPRTIFESMASSTLVVASSVGAIPHELTDKSNVILVKPKSVNEIVSAVIKVKDDFDLRKKIITNGFHLSKKKNIDFGVNELLKNL